MTKETAAKKIAFTIARDYWDANGARVCKGDVVEMTAEEAIDGVASGALVRVGK